MNAIPASGPSSQRERFAAFMAEVLVQHARAKRDPDADSIHDLRVALRRALSVAGPMQRLDAGADWDEMRRAGRRLFRRLGDLRDLHVQAAWVAHFDPAGDSLGELLRRDLAREERATRRRAAKAIAAFRRKRWARWGETLPARLDRLEAEPSFLPRLAITQLGWAQAHHQGDLEAERRYHRLRIELKRLRYFLEAFLPALHAELVGDLKTVQDLLGEAHDLDLLEDRLAALPAAPGAARLARWQGHFTAAKRERLRAYAVLCEDQALWPRLRQRLLAELAARGRPSGPPPTAD